MKTYGPGDLVYTPHQPAGGAVHPQEGPDPDLPGLPRRPRTHHRDHRARHDLRRDGHRRTADARQLRRGARRGRRVRHEQGRRTTTTPRRLPHRRTHLRDPRPPPRRASSSGSQTPSSRASPNASPAPSSPWPARTAADPWAGASRSSSPTSSSPRSPGPPARPRPRSSTSTPTRLWSASAAAASTSWTLTVCGAPRVCRSAELQRPGRLASRRCRVGATRPALSGRSRRIRPAPSATAPDGRVVEQVVGELVLEVAACIVDIVPSGRLRRGRAVRVWRHQASGGLKTPNWLPEGSRR